MLYIPVHYIKNAKEYLKKKESYLVIFMLILMLISIANGYSLNKRYFQNNIEAMLILVFGLLYLILFKHSKYISKNQFIKLLLFYLTAALFFGIIYILNAQIYFVLRSYWTVNKNVILVKDSLSIHRFTFIFSDPNNASVAFNTALAYILFNSEQNAKINFFSLSSVLFLTIITMSNTGLILYIVNFIFHMIKTNKILRVGRINLSRLLVLLMLASVFLFIYNPIIRIVTSREIFNIFINRVSSNSGSSRYKIWNTLLQNKIFHNYLFYGDGGTVLLYGVKFLPHNGHLHLIYSYGFIFYLLYLYIFFMPDFKKGISKNLFIVFLLFGFTVNVGIYEPRFQFFMSLIIGIEKNIHC